MKLPLVLVLSGLPAFAGEDPSPRGTLTSGTATLLSREKHGDHEKARFNFELGIRDGHGLHRRHDDWSLEFGDWGDTFNVFLVTDDRSVIVDLGAKGFDDITELPAFPAFKEQVTTRVNAVEGHAYAVHTRDGDSDSISLFRVAKLLAGDRCTIEWVHWEPAPASGPELELAPDARARLSAALAKASQVQEGEPLRDPVDILLRVNTGAQGGNPSRVALDGSTYRLPAEMESEGETPRPRTGGEPSWYLRGGFIAKDRVLVVESVDLFAMAPGDSNGHGEAILQLPSGPIFEICDETGPFQVWFEGLELVRTGEEASLLAEVANSSALEARVRGRLVTFEEAARLEPRLFHPAVAPAGLPRAGGEVDARRYLLERPSLVLQVRSGAGGGNPNRVTMLGRGSIYLGSLSNEPIDLAVPIDMHEESIGYTDGGRIPRNRVFLVKKVTWRAWAAGDSNGHGEALLRIGSQEIFRIRDTAAEQQGTWTGAVEIRPGEEASIFLEVANSSLAEARLEGEWK